MSAFLPLTMDLTRFTVLIGLEWVLALVVIPSLARMRCVTASPVELLPAVGSPS